MKTTILVGDVRERLRELPDASVQCCVTSPPYWGLRDYGQDAQIGLEQTPDKYVAQMVDVFREVRRVLRDDGTLWLNLGDSYASDKQLSGIPWRVAFALQADGWWLRQDIIWHKPNPMPESVTDRCTKAHEYVFLLSKSARYFYDADAISEPSLHAGEVKKNNSGKNAKMGDFGATRGGFLKDQGVTVGDTRNRRSVWSITTKTFSGAHFAVMPPDLADLCIKAGSKEGDTVLDPFGGAGTTALVANGLNRNAILCEINPEYVQIANDRIKETDQMFTKVEIR